jgi:hypothetical protein
MNSRYERLDRDERERRELMYRTEYTSSEPSATAR